jgi:hypothetical protein
LTVINTSYFEPGTPKHRHEAGGGCIPGSVIPVYCIGLHVQFSRSAEKAHARRGLRRAGLSKLNSMRAPLDSRRAPKGFVSPALVRPSSFGRRSGSCSSSATAVCGGRHEQPLQSWSYP